MLFLLQYAASTIYELDLKHKEEVTELSMPLP